MTSHPSRDRPAVDTRREEGEWLPLVAFGFVLFALVALAVTPALLLQRFSKAIDEITMTLLPAYEGVGSLAFAMEERIASSRSRFLTADSAYAIRFERARAAETAALGDIEALAPRLGAISAGHVESLQRYIARRDSLEATVLATGREREAFLEEVPRFDALRDSMLAELRGLNQDLKRMARERTADEARLAGRFRSISIVLGAIAVLAALLVGWFAGRQHRLRLEIQRALKEANRQRAIAERHAEELERATAARVRLLRGITHDVKNPLGAAKGYAELLQMEVKAPLLPEQRPFLEGIQRSVDGALAIIADLLDLARSDSEGLSVKRVKTDLGAVAAAAVANHRSAAEAAGHTIEVQRPAQPLEVFTDPARVGQILGNLLSNAIKYTPPPGRITVRSGIESGSDGATCVTIRVSDTGRGIASHQREAIFDEFTRLEEGGAQKGRGLGLPIARRIARLLGGDLTVEDAPGGEAAFVLWLPVRQAAEAPAPERGTG